MQEPARRLRALLMVLLAATAVPLASARLLVFSNTTLTPLTEITALLGLPKEQLDTGVSARDFLSVLAKAVNTTDMLVQQKADMCAGLYQLALDLTSKALEGPKDTVLQSLDKTFTVKLPAAIPNITYPSFNITDFPVLPWLNKSVTIKGFPTYSFLNWSLGFDVPHIPILDSKVILSNKFTQATLEMTNGSRQS